MKEDVDGWKVYRYYAEKKFEILVNTFSNLEVNGEVRSIRHCFYVRLQKN